MTSSNSMLLLLLLLVFAILGEVRQSCNPVSDPREPQIPVTAGALTKEESRLIRDAIYSGNNETAFPRKGRWAFFEILVVPKPIVDIYQQKQESTLRLLASIVEGGRRADALLAAGYAAALAISPVAGFIRSTWPQGEGIDDVDKILGMTRRDQLRDQTQDLIIKVTTRK